MLNEGLKRLFSAGKRFLPAYDGVSKRLLPAYDGGSKRLLPAYDGGSKFFTLHSSLFIL